MADKIEAMKYCMAGVSAVASLQNLLTIAVFAGTRKFRVRFYAFVANLALADLIYAVCTIIRLTLPYSLVFEGFITGAYTVSVLTILSVAVNRYLALSLMPLTRYNSLVTGRRLLGVCVIMWVLSLVYGTVIYAAVPKLVFYMVHFVAYPIIGGVVWLIIVVVYYLAFRKIKQYTPPLASAAGISADEERDQTRVKQTRRLLVIFVIILVTSFIAWAPSSVMRVIAILNPVLGRDKDYQAWMWGTYFLYTLSILINPWIYWWLLEGFKEGFYAIFCRCVIKPKPSAIEAGLTVNETSLAEEGL